MRARLTPRPRNRARTSTACSICSLAQAVRFTTQLHIESLKKKSQELGCQGRSFPVAGAGAPPGGPPGAALDEASLGGGASPERGMPNTWLLCNFLLAPQKGGAPPEPGMPNTWHARHLAPACCHQFAKIAQLRHCIAKLLLPLPPHHRRQTLLELQEPAAAITPVLHSER